MMATCACEARTAWGYSLVNFQGVDAKFQTSFIPKQPLAPRPVASPGHISLFYLISLIIFIVMLGLVGALFIYKHILNQDIQTLSTQLVDARNSFELDTLSELKRTSVRLETAKQLLDGHDALSHFLDIFSNSTYSNVTYKDLAIHPDSAGLLTAEADGTTNSFNTLALESEEFGALASIKAFQFSGFSLDDKGHINFKVSAVIDPNLVSYKHYISQ